MDWIGYLIETGGYFGVFLLMFIEAVFPPIPSEVIMPLAGMQAAQGQGSLVVMILAGSAGAMGGNIFWFWLAWKLGNDRFERFLIRHGRIFTIDSKEIARGRWLFERFGGPIVGIARNIPTMRALISVPAGLVRMDVRRFMIYSTIGTLVSTSTLTIAGYLLGQRFTEVHRLMGPVATTVLLICLAIYAYRVMMWPKWQARSTKAEQAAR